MKLNDYQPEKCDHCDRIMVNEPIKVKLECYCIKINGSVCQECNMIIEKLIDRLYYKIIK